MKETQQFIFILVLFYMSFLYFNNKITENYSADEKKYSSYSGNKEDDFKLLDFKNEDVIDKSELYQFLEELELKNIKIIIGGCCGYGIEEMKELV